VGMGLRARPEPWVAGAGGHEPGPSCEMGPRLLRVADLSLLRVGPSRSRRDSRFVRIGVCRNEHSGKMSLCEPEVSSHP
jgi:hypothetical protein